MKTFYLLLIFSLINIITCQESSDGYTKEQLASVGYFRNAFCANKGLNPGISVYGCSFVCGYNLDYYYAPNGVSCTDYNTNVKGVCQDKKCIAGSCTPCGQIAGSKGVCCPPALSSTEAGKTCECGGVFFCLNNRDCNNGKPNGPRTCDRVTGKCSN